jgi:integrase
VAHFGIADWPALSILAPLQLNPSTTTISSMIWIKGAAKRTNKPRNIAFAEFQRFIVHLGEPFGTMALMRLLRLCISEALALRWSYVDWLNGRLRVERGNVCQKVDDVKTDE